MPATTEYAPGTPSWVDLGTPDVEATVAFYGGLFGWEIPESPIADQTGGYRTATSGGRSVGGVMPLMAPEQPAVWSSYVSVDDADAIAGAVAEAGGDVIAGPMDVMDLGRMAMFADPTGAAVGIWQPKAMKGAEVVNEPGSLCWNELHTRDPDAAAAFYSAVFGWTPAPGEQGGEGYLTFHRADDAPVAGLVDIRGKAPDDVPAHWLVYFAVDDCDATVAKAAELGGSTVLGPIDIPIGRFAELVDPNGSSFAVIGISATA
jgi:predicted enzyme related to lactoylglutathione lyase